MEALCIDAVIVPPILKQQKTELHTSEQHMHTERKLLATLAINHFKVTKDCRATVAEAVPKNRKKTTKVVKVTTV